MDPDDPPRRRANKVKGHGTFANDRPPVLGVVGRDTGQLQLEVCAGSGRAELVPRVLASPRAQSKGCLEGKQVYTDEWHPYATLPDHARPHATVCHSKQRPGGHEYARDDDGDGMREVHCNTLEGIWTGVRNFLRTFRGVSKGYLGQYAAMFEWTYNTAVVTAEFIRALAIGSKKNRLGS